ncbi:MAG: isocitrate lyase/phosphoenolpyruvate mutase family protein [Pseudonocardiales bacterium]|nr:isocitrate lyase/phosphoenolpyruvate mutase family protein [Pseudonocardiales bacterium]MBV9032803.1 isocitrate lyase/phosphoenolpyruvate mutase family protein [Pseudonocardiales bacterium]MBW0009230.1 isocitrate lyase/phosphoenolpyruvate mutase family protein [Pseudonocardiales bacterium]
MDIKGFGRTTPDTTDPTQREKAELFRRLHAEGDMLVLPNVWDVGSAALLARLPGVRAVATTSAGVAGALGVPDGEHLDFDQMLAVVSRLIQAVSVPVSVDLEAGYGATPQYVADAVAAMIEAGAVGVNLEDGLSSNTDRLMEPEFHAERVAAACSVGAQVGLPLVVNARTDTYWRSTGARESRFDETVRRLRTYHDAGADCLFVPAFPPSGLEPARQRELIGELVAALDGAPLNLLARPDLPSVPELRRLGVRRLSVGSALYRLSMATARDAFADLLNSGRQEALRGADDLTYQDLLDALPEPEQRCGRG